MSVTFDQNRSASAGPGFEEILTLRRQQPIAMAATGNVVANTPTGPRRRTGRSLTIMALNVDLLRSSFNLVIEIEPDLTGKFYATLFEQRPEARALFGADTRKQSDMLAGALIAVVDHLEDGEWLTDTLGGLGAKHPGYGVTPDMYEWVGTALLTTLAAAAGDAWTDELNTAWADAYGAISSLMIAGVDEASIAA